MITIPLNIFVTPFAERGQAEDAAWSCASANSAIEVVNRIWSVADIKFGVKECSVDKPLDMAKDARTDDKRMLNTLSYRRPAGGAVHIFLINAVTGLGAGGLSYLNSDPEAAAYVQWYIQTEANARALAHELGHLLSLDHPKINYADEKRAAKEILNLMKEGLSTGTDLTAKQISDAKGSDLAKKFGSK